jgi:AcrR family transcriptional regulator
LTTAPNQRTPTNSLAKAKKSELTRQRILDAAAAAFRDLGFASTRLSDIAERASLQTPSIYYHFSSKEELVEEVLRIGVERTFEHVQQQVSQVPVDDPLGRLRAAIRAHLTMALATGQYSAANLRLYGQMPADIRRRLLRTQRRVGRYWNDLLVAAQDAGVVRAELHLSAVRMLILGALNWATEWYDPRGLSVDEIADQATIVMLDGIRADRTTAA